MTKLNRVRLSVKKGTAPDVGSFVELKARLLPPLGPQRPGSYDFGRDLYFQGIGASGFVMGAVKTREPPATGGFALRYAAFMQGLRDAIDARIRTTLDGDQRAIATALLTGRRDAISTPVNDAMFISGLGHVLSISGYHMAVVAGVVFFAVRALLALFPALTAGHPIKKWAAAAALVAAAFYLLLSGAEVATQRSFFMTAVVLLAVIVDRRAITFRTLAVAALIVLAIAPEALVHPSFQMSFAATLGLVALVQIGLPNLLASPDHSATARVALWGGRELTMPDAGLAGGGAGDDALCRIPFPPRDALRAACEPCGDACRLGGRDAGRPARARRHAGRLRRTVLGDHGSWHRLDDPGDAMGRRTPGRGRPHGGVRHRAADRSERRHHPARAAAHAAALVRRGAAAGGLGLGAQGAAAGRADLGRRPQRRGAWR
ncbi:ComEC/Rec2-related protein [Bradyrhizobium sp. USDA 4523]|nr:ComEC/Rec2-related protein [Bradyrhizobium sp. USDA 4538]MCP1904868.1 ComEC/Rec2-related protein [Bradyrhizobium sp. USDA 4537]MCP1989476.1 ComEC/Rec2-related protein [Bradyrhizobium sp. USDA 4539]